MYECESWTIKKAECRRIDAFELQCWKRLLRAPWTARRSNFSKGNQSWIFIGRTDAEAETAMHRPPDVKNWLIGKTQMLGKIEGRRRRGQQRWLDGITGSMDMSLSKLWTGKPVQMDRDGQPDDGQGSLACCSPWGHREPDTTEQLNWNEHSKSVK